MNLKPIVTLFDHLVNCLRKRTEAQRNHESYGPGKRRSLGFVVCRQLCCYDVLLRIIVPSTKGIVFCITIICNCKLHINYKLPYKCNPHFDCILAFKRKLFSYGKVGKLWHHYWWLWSNHKRIKSIRKIIQFSLW